MAGETFTHLGDEEYTRRLAEWSRAQAEGARLEDERKTAQILQSLQEMGDLSALIAGSKSRFFESGDQGKVIKALTKINEIRAGRAPSDELLGLIGNLKYYLDEGELVAGDPKYNPIREKFGPIFQIYRPTGGGRRRKTLNRRRKTKRTRKHRK
jgi:hypothetical protein